MMDFHFVNTHDSKERTEHEDKFDYEDEPDLIIDVKQEILEKEAPCIKVQKSPSDSEAKHNGLPSKQDEILIKTEVKEKLNNGKNLCEEFEGSKIKDEELDKEEGDMEQNNTRHNDFRSEQDEILINTEAKEELNDCKKLCEEFEGSKIKDEELDIKEGDMEQNKTSTSSNTFGQRNVERNAAQQFSGQTDEVICDNETNLEKRNDKVNMHTCNQCGYQTVYKYVLTSHLRIHKSHGEAKVFKCDQCDFQSIWKSALRSHSLRHKNPKEVETFKCDKCTYQTIRRDHLTRHLVQHKDPSEVVMFKCDHCDFQTIHKRNIGPHRKLHEYSHRNPQGEVICNNDTNIEKRNNKGDVYKCDQCDYQTAFKYVLQNHLRIHKNGEEPSTFKCDQCDFQTVWKNSLKLHRLQHKNPEEIETYKCDKCNYQTIRKVLIIRHLSGHKDPSEASIKDKDPSEASFKDKQPDKSSELVNQKNMEPYAVQQFSGQTWKDNVKNRLAEDRKSIKNSIFQCNQCGFQTKYEKVLRKHLIQHKRPRDVHKRNIDAHRKLHEYSHRNPHDEVICDTETNHKKKNDKVDIYKCDQCDYQTVHKYVLKNHLRIHKNGEEANTFKCDHCDFRTVWKNALKLHCLQHKNPEDVETFKCDKCNYQTTRKLLIIRHLARHEDPSEADPFICDQCSNQRNHKKELNQPSIEDKEPKHEDLFSEQEGTLVKPEDKGELNNYMDIKEELDIKEDETEQNEISSSSNCFDSEHQADYAGQQSIEQTGKGNKRNRALSNTKTSKVRIFECNECGTKVSKDFIFKCNECDFQTKYKHNLGHHLILHRKPEEVKMFKCDHCDYQTVHKRNLRTHKLRLHF